MNTHFFHKQQVDGQCWLWIVGRRTALVGWKNINGKTSKLSYNEFQGGIPFPAKGYRTVPREKIEKILSALGVALGRTLTVN